MNTGVKTVVVLGKPRGGTSVTAGLLAILGVDMAGDEMPTPFNPRGAYEDTDFDELNARILRAAGSDDNALFAPPALETVLALRGTFDEEIREFFARKAKPHIWGWKKPSTNFLIELFLPHLVNPHFVVVSRDPMDTAVSLVDFAWQWRHVSVADMVRLVEIIDDRIATFLRRHPDLPVLSVEFERIVEDPRAETVRLAEFLGLRLDQVRMRVIRRLVIPRDRIEAEKRLALLKWLPRRATAFGRRLGRRRVEAAADTRRLMRLLAKRLFGLAGRAR